MPSTRLFKRIQSLSSKPLYLGLLFMLAAVDYLTVFVPIDLFLISAVLLRPQKWLRISLVMALGSIAGGMIVAGLVFWAPHFLQEHVLSGNEGIREAWKTVSHFIHQYGAWAVGVSALIPIPQQPTLIVATATGLSFWTLLWAFGIGRLIKFLAIGFIAAESPTTLLKLWPSLRSKLHEVGYEESLDHPTPLGDAGPRPRPA